MRRAFTIVELLVSIAIIAVLLALLAPALAGVRRHARNSTCLSNLRQHAADVCVYRADHKGEWGSCWGEHEADGIFRCPANRADLARSYLFPVYDGRSIDAWNPAEILIGHDRNFFHPWKNAGYLDGHAALLK